jgi:hypothetical protein
MVTASTLSIRTQFFYHLYDGQEGFICIAHTSPDIGKSSFSQDFFRWPNQKDDLLSFIESIVTRHNIWFCINLLNKPARRKENCLPTNLVWADLDECDPLTVDPKPPVILETSPKRYQAIWRLDQVVEPHVAENYSKRIAYANAKNGADPSGWDLTQLLRVPETYNYKYENTPTGVAQVKLVKGLDVKVPVQLFEAVDQAPLNEVDKLLEEGIPTELPDVKLVLYKYSKDLDRLDFTPLYEYLPDDNDDWSKLLWRLINVCFEAGMTPEETFVVAQTSKCNKYERDSRPLRYLWREVLKASAAHTGLKEVEGTFVPLVFPGIVPTEQEIPSDTFVNQYKNWAENATDAIPAFHELAAFILLSTALAGHIRLATNYGEVVPNLWGLILGDSTLTRKTTAMRMAMDLLTEIDPEYILATDGSAEGLLTGLSKRPGRTSVYFRDEVSGMFDAMHKKDYLAGMPEILTQLYDVPEVFKRQLRKETVYVTKPVFIFFGGGIKDRVYQLLNEDYILSGFLPRFLVVSGEADITKIRRTGPSTHESSAAKERIRNKLVDLLEAYRQTVEIKVGSQTTSINKPVDAFLTPEAWAAYGEIEHSLAITASQSPYASLALPTYERQSRSLLKMSVLLGASRQEPQASTIAIEPKDVYGAAIYIERWAPHVIDMIQNAGKSTHERAYEKVLRLIRKEPGILRGVVMQYLHLTKREMDDIQHTLADRGTIIVRRERNGTRYYLG